MELRIFLFQHNFKVIVQERNLLITRHCFHLKLDAWVGDIILSSPQILTNHSNHNADFTAHKQLQLDKRCVSLTTKQQYRYSSVYVHFIYTSCRQSDVHIVDFDKACIF